MRVIARPAPHARTRAKRTPITSWKKHSSAILHAMLGTCILFAVVPNMRQIAPSLASHVAPAPSSWIAGATLLTLYGRGFGQAPVLGSLGESHSLDDMASRLAGPAGAISRNTGGRPVRYAIHLIYGLATPCTQNPTCLLYLDDSGVDVVKQYIEPAAQRGWLVILDDQLGHSNPAAEMQRLADRGYLAYDNVEVAFDPEFRTTPSQETPGAPIGSVTAAELNDAMAIADSVCRDHALAHRKLMLVHQWTTSMIVGRRDIRRDLSTVQAVVVMDGIGPSDEKAAAYNSLLPHAAVHGLLTGIKLFPPNRYDPSGHWDTPVLNWRQLFGHAVAGLRLYLRPVPRVIVMT